LKKTGLLKSGKKSGNLHEVICHIIISDMYKAKINRRHCLASMAGLSISITLLTETYVREKYKRKALSLVHVDKV